MSIRKRPLKKKFWSQRLTAIVRFNFHTLHRKQISAPWCFRNLDPPQKLLQVGLACSFLCSVLRRREPDYCSLFVCFPDCSQLCFPLQLKHELGLQSLVFCRPPTGSRRASRFPPGGGGRHLPGGRWVGHLGLLQMLLADLSWLPHLPDCHTPHMTT